MYIWDSLSKASVNNNNGKSANSREVYHEH